MLWGNKKKEKKSHSMMDGRIASSSDIDKYNNAIDIMQSNSVDGFRKMLELAENGFVLAQNNVAGYLFNGVGTEKDNNKAYYWYSKAYQNGDYLAGLNKAQFLMHGIGTERNLDAAMKICLDTIKKDNDYAEGASSLLDEIIAMRNRNSMDKFIQTGLNDLKTGNYQGALENFNQAILIDDSNWGLFNNRAIAKSYLDDYAGALEDLSNAISLNGNNPNLYQMRAMMKMNLGYHSEAEVDFEKANLLEGN